MTRSACDCDRPGCSSPGKHPRTKNGLNDATTDTNQIRTWWGASPTANIGAVVPDRFIVVDVDVADPTAVFRSDELPATAMARTGRGHHLIYRTITPIRPKVGVREHIDLRGPGSYIVVPPSLHSSGVRYEWVVPLEDGIADAPAWIAEAERSRRSADDRPGDSDSISDGERNVRLTSLAGTMRRRGMTRPRSRRRCYGPTRTDAGPRCPTPRSARSPLQSGASQQATEVMAPA